METNLICPQVGNFWWIQFFGSKIMICSLFSISFFNAHRFRSWRIIFDYSLFALFLRNPWRQIGCRVHSTLICYLFSMTLACWAHLLLVLSYGKEDLMQMNCENSNVWDSKALKMSGGTSKGSCKCIPSISKYPN